MKKLMQMVKRPTEQRGFTLIELLVVVAILGILAAVVVPNVSRFVGSGTQEAANTELSNVQAAVDAAIADRSLTSVIGSTGCGDVDKDFSDAACVLNLGADGLVGGSGADADVFLYPDYLRILEAGGGRTYTFLADPMGLVTQVVP